jgi:hypothetical protein
MAPIKNSFSIVLEKMFTEKKLLTSQFKSFSKITKKHYNMLILSKIYVSMQEMKEALESMNAGKKILMSEFLVHEVIVCFVLNLD